MEQGRQLDAEVAQKLFRWIVIWENSEGGECYFVRNDKSKLPVPHFSTNENEAYRIVRGLQEKGYFCKINSRAADFGSVYKVHFYTPSGAAPAAEAKSLATAICGAALALQNPQLILTYSQ